jgi:hypothetical protein
LVFNNKKMLISFNKNIQIKCKVFLFITNISLTK